MNVPKKLPFIALFFITLITLPLTKGYSDQEDNTVRMALTEWPPYTGSEFNKLGYLAEITSEALTAGGYQVEYVILPWQRILMSVEHGIVDGVVALYYHSDRENYLNYTDTIGTSSIVFVTLSSSDIPSEYNSLKDLAEYPIGVVRGYLQAPDFDNADYLIKDYSADSILNVKQLINRRNPVIIDDLYTIKFIITTQFPEYLNRIKILSPILYERDILNAFSKKNPNYRELTEAFNKGLEIIKSNGKYNEIINSHTTFFK